jgi:hypothetical protein
MNTFFLITNTYGGISMSDENKKTSNDDLLQSLPSYEKVANNLKKYFKTATTFEGLSNYITTSNNIIELFKEMELKAELKFSETVSLSYMKSLCNKMVGYDRKEEINNSWESFRDNALKLALLRFKSNKSKWTIKDNKLKVQHNKVVPMLSSEGKEVPNSDTSLIDAKVKHILEDFSRHFVDQSKKASGGNKTVSTTSEDLINVEKYLKGIEKKPLENIYSIKESDIETIKKIFSLSYKILVQYNHYKGCTDEDDNFIHNKDYVNKVVNDLMTNEKLKQSA